MKICLFFIGFLGIFIGVCQSQPTFEQFLISDQTESTEGLYICDLDSDGDNDVAAASGYAGNSEVRWYNNNLIVGVDQRGFMSTVDRVFPNPFGNVVRLSCGFSNTSEVFIQVLSNLGIEVARFQFPKQPDQIITLEIPTEKLPEGLLFFKILRGDEVLMVKGVHLSQ